MYNSEKYIGRCIDSVLNQTYQDFELLVINDGSTDSSFAIVSAYDDKRIRLLEQTNKGPGAARNLGLRKANGSHVCFLDSDDYYSPTFLFELHSLLTVFKTRVAFVGVNRVYENGQIDIISYSKETKKMNVNYNEMVKNGNFLAYWCGIYEKKLIEDIFFDETMRYMYEDLLFSFRVMSRVNEYSVSNESLYNYYLNTKSLTKKGETNGSWNNKCFSAVLFNFSVVNICLDKGIKEMQYRIGASINSIYAYSRYGRKWNLFLSKETFFECDKLMKKYLKYFNLINKLKYYYIRVSTIFFTKQ